MSYGHAWALWLQPLGEGAIVYGNAGLFLTQRLAAKWLVWQRRNYSHVAAGRKAESAARDATA